MSSISPVGLFWEVNPSWIPPGPLKVVPLKVGEREEREAHKSFDRAKRQRQHRGVRMEHERGREIERASEEHRLYMTETRQVLENGVWENGERMPQNSRRILMGYLEKPWLNGSDNWKAVMAEVRYESALAFMEKSGSRNVYGARERRVKTLTMAGGGAHWYNYQLHLDEGETSLRLFREDREGLEELHRETLVMTDWDGDEQVVLIEREAELQPFLEECERVGIETWVYDDPACFGWE